MPSRKADGTKRPENAKLSTETSAATNPKHGKTLDLFAARTIEPTAPMETASPARPTAALQASAPRPRQDAAPQQRTAAAQPSDVAERRSGDVAQQGPRTYRVSELVRLAGRAVEARFGEVWVEGEISNLRQPGEHAYFTLKDAEGQLPAAMFRSALARLRFRLTDGLKVRVRGRLSIYDVQGKLQLYVEAVEPAGLGALQLAIEQLKRRLQAEGLFAEERKRALPFLPRRIGVATSGTGAAVRDVIRVALRRGPVRLLVAPCLVQGDEALADIVRALAALQQQPDVDLIIVGRGGGSAEDLMAFNDERVARAIAASRVPVISAVGHEIDWTVADLVADKRAATPSQAAELAVPVYEELQGALRELRQRLDRAMRRTVLDARSELDDEAAALREALQEAIDVRWRVLDALEGRLRAQHPRARLAEDRARLDALRYRLERPLREGIARGRSALVPLDQRLHVAMHDALTSARGGLGTLGGKLDALSPLRVLERGYATVHRADGATRAIVTRASELAPGERIRVRFARGAAEATVTAVDGGDET